MDLAELVARQAGVLSSAQAQECGLSVRTVHRRVAQGRWRRLHPRVFLVDGHRVTAEARVRAAWLWAGGCVSGPAAAWWHGLLDEVPGEVSLALVTARTSRPGVRVRRRRVAVEDRVEVAGIRLTGRARTVLETAVALPHGARFLDRALQRHVPFAEVSAAYSRMLGAHGSAQASRLLVAAADSAHSGAERVLLRILRDAGLTGWALHVPVGPYEVDVAFLRARVAVEVDGWAWHSDVERFRTDRRKGNALVAAGWTLLRFTWHDLDRDPARVAREITRAVRHAA